MNEQLMDAHGVAERLGVKTKTVYANWRTWGLPQVRIGGGQAGLLRFRAADVAKLVQSWAGER